MQVSWDGGLQGEADKTGGTQPTKREYLADVTTCSCDPQPTPGQLSPAQSCLKVRVCLSLSPPRTAVSNSSEVSPVCFFPLDEPAIKLYCGQTEEQGLGKTQTKQSGDGSVYKELASQGSHGNHIY